MPASAPGGAGSGATRPRSSAPRSRPGRAPTERRTRRVTIHSGAEAPAVIATRRAPASQATSTRGLVVDEVGAGALAAGDLDEALGVGRAAGAGDEDDVGLAGDLAHRRLAVGGRVADVLRGGPAQGREAGAQHLDDLVGLVDRERRLGQVGDALGVGGLDCAAASMSSTRRIASGASPRVPSTSSWSAWPMRKIVRPSRREPAGLDVHLADERAGGVDHLERPSRRLPPHRRRDAVGGEDDRRALGHLGRARRRTPPPAAQAGDDVLVVDDLLAHVDGCTVAWRGRARRPRSRARPRRRTSAGPAA